jgi:LmbE family N-acetylglucosaminyl deacetylase
VLAIAPHPDDEIIGCGGALLRHAAAGDPTTVVYLTSGGLSAGHPWLSERERAARREQEAMASCAVLQTGPPVFLDATPGTLDRSPALAGELCRILTQRRPKAVYVPHEAEANDDHAAAHRLLRGVFLGAPGLGTCTVFAYEVWTPVAANCAVDVSAVMRTKLRALRCHRVALDAFNYVVTVRGLAAYRSGTMLGGRGYAEAFHRSSSSDGGPVSPTGPAAATSDSARSGPAP